jgi:hypothetical protein
MSNPFAEETRGTRADPLVDRGLRPDRLHYATGALLDREDFLAEQLYHRGRLARALLLLHGPGTVAGLRVRVEAVEPEERDASAGAFAAAPEPYERVRVEPGAAIDRLGRLVEVPAAACLRLERWLGHQRPGDLSAALFYSADEKAPHAAANPEEEDAPGWGKWRGRYLLADLYLRFAACERGKTPAFATGPYDALDAVAPSRVRDGYELKLFPQPHPKRDPDPWTGASGTRAVQDELLGRAYPADERLWEDDRRVKPPRHHHPRADPTAVLLARLFVPVRDDGYARDAAAPVRVDNHLRPFAYPGPALARLAESS